MFYVTTTDRRRRERWQAIFGTDQLPVLSAKPRWQVGRGEFRETEFYAYDLAVAGLHWMAAQRAADKLGVSVDDLARLPIKAGADITVETAVSDSWQKRPFVFAREQSGAVAYA